MWYLQKKQSYSLSTDLRVFKHACATPLSTIQMCCELSRRTSANQETRALFTQIQVASNRFSDLLNQLVNHHYKQQKCNLLHTINEILPLFEQHNVHIQCYSTYTKSIHFHCNKLQLQEILVCLITNAIESYETLQQKHVHIGVKVVSGWIYLIVSDFGKGWQKQYRKIPKSSKKQGGTGLRYAYTSVIDQLRGSIQIETKPEMGTRVLLKLPLAPGKRNHNS